MLGQLDVSRIASARLGSARVPFMLTGSYAMAHYTTPRMTRDLDFVVALGMDEVDAVVELLLGITALLKDHVQ